MTSPQLLAIVEVPREDRVRCQASGCNHVVFRRIHVIRENTVIRVYGSECFKKLFEGAPVFVSAPYYTSSEGRHLTEEERRLLLENTERLIAQLETEYQAELARREAATLQASTVAPPPQEPEPQVSYISSAAKQTAVAQAKQLISSKYGVNPELPGWHGLVKMEVERILRENAG